MRRTVTAIIFSAVLAACGPNPQPAEPALWHVACPDDREAWLFGTIHTLERPAAWRGEVIDRALERADLLMLEIDPRGDAQAHNAVFAKLASSPDQGPLSARVPPAMRPALARLLEKHGISDDHFAGTETWAAALTLAQAIAPDQNSEYGIDRAVVQAAPDTPVEALEGLEGQLRIFDTLPEIEQRDLLEAVVSDAAASGSTQPDLAAAWRNGDMNAIEKETGRGMLADPELREALFTGRNRRWTQRIRQAMHDRRRPFAAVGAAHLAGPDGLPAMLAAQGCTAARIQ